MKLNVVKAKLSHNNIKTQEGNGYAPINGKCDPPPSGTYGRLMEDLTANWIIAGLLLPARGI